MIEIRLLKEKYRKIDGLYEAFKSGKIENNDEFLSKETVMIENDTKFPMYISIKDEELRGKKFLEAFKVISENYNSLDRNITTNARFWHSLLCQNFRDYILENYPEVLEDEKNFNNVVLKKFDWENYIYKCLIGAQYVIDNVQEEKEQERYFKLIADNLDLYNYIIKYQIFRNDKFLLKILDIIEKYDISTILKGKIKSTDLKGRKAENYTFGKDERYGRRVIFEFNKSYPVLMVPMLNAEELEEKFFEFLNYYYDVSKIEMWESNRKYK
ncbi:MAG: DUF6339 family protein [Clostridium sp.]